MSLTKRLGRAPLTSTVRRSPEEPGWQFSPSGYILFPLAPLISCISQGNEPLMLPTAITLRNYRSFAGPVRLELRPITLLFGINNAGKSALLRFLPILSDSLAPTATGPLDLESPAARGSSFQDLRWKGLGEDDDPDLSLSISWDEAPGPYRIEISVTSFGDLRRLIIRRFTIWTGATLLLTAEWQPKSEERTAQELTYEIQTANGEAKILALIVFKGLVPTSWPKVLQSLLAPAADRLRGLQNEVQWLTTARRPPDRISPFPTGPRWRMRPDGSDAATVLAASPDLLSEVSSWYESQLQRRLRVIEVPPGGVRLALTNLERATFDIDVTDTGEGMIQVLPVLTALALARRQSLGGPGILAIEEPESNLHASLQRALAESLCDLAAIKAPPRIILETHSEQLLLGVQLQIVRGRISTDDVVVYWVRQLENGESLVEPVTFDRDARPQGAWPPGVFADDTEVAREIIQARRERVAP